MQQAADSDTSSHQKMLTAGLFQFVVSVAPIQVLFVAFTPTQQDAVLKRGTIKQVMLEVKVKVGMAAHGAVLTSSTIKRHPPLAPPHDRLTASSLAWVIDTSEAEWRILLLLPLLALCMYRPIRALGQPDQSVVMIKLPMGTKRGSA